MNDLTVTAEKRLANVTDPVLDDAEIFAACPLVVEDRDAYKHLFLDCWRRVRPLDGFEADNVRHMVNSLWSARRLGRLDGVRLRLAALRAVVDEISRSTYAQQYWSHDDAEVRAAELVERAAGNRKGAVKKVERALATAGLGVDVGVLMALRDRADVGADVHILINSYLEYADRCLRRIWKYRQRLAKMQAFTVDDQ
jgi:hypothetical protein